MDDAERSGLQQVLSVARRRWISLLVIPLVAVLVGGIATSRMDEQYESTAILLAGKGGDAVGTIDQVDAASSAAVSLATMATDRVVVEDALRTVGAEDVSATDLSRRTTVTVPSDSQKIEISVRDGDPVRASMLANAIARSFAELVTREQVARLSLSATMWQPAVAADEPAAPSMLLNLLAALVLGLLAAAAFATVREAVDATWRSERDVESSLELPVLVVIPEMRAVARRRRIGALR